MSRENVESLRHGFELWNVASSDPDEKTWRAAMHEMVAAYHPDAKLDFSRTLPDFPTTDVKEAMTAWIESARGTFTDVRLGANRTVQLRYAGDRPVGGRADDKEHELPRHRRRPSCGRRTIDAEKRGQAMSRENVEVVRRAVEAFDSGELAANPCADLHADVEAEVPPDASAEPDTCRGRDADPPLHRVDPRGGERDPLPRASASGTPATMSSSHCDSPRVGMTD